MYFLWLTFLFSVSHGVLNRGNKQHLLDLHNTARRTANGPVLPRLMIWHPGLANEAEYFSNECSDITSSPSQSTLTSAVNNKFSWIGANLYIGSPTTSNVIDNSTLGQIFNCWLEGKSPCKSVHKEQILHPDSYLIGCGAKVYSSNDRCHVITSGLKVTCFFAPGYFNADGSSVPQRNGQCPSDASHIVDGLCSNTTIAPIVPIDSTNTPTPTAKTNVYLITPTYGSIAGGTLLTLHGIGFSPDQFNNDNPNLGNKVSFYNDQFNITCKVEPYYSSTRKIVCRTSASPDGSSLTYNIEVFVDGKSIEQLGGRMCNRVCKFRYLSSATPTVESITPLAIVPDVNISVSGRILTYQVSGAQEVSENSRNQVIDRILIGGELCNPWSENQTTAYGGSVNTRGYGSVSCKPDTTRIDSMNATIVLSQFGNSMTSCASYAISNKFQRYIFQTHAEITGIEPSTGSPNGGTLITIYGKHFDDPFGDVKAYISGVPCKVVNYTSNTIDCITGPANQSHNDSLLYQGGRGLCREVWLGNNYTSNLNQIEARPYGCYGNSSNWSVEERMLRSDTDPSPFGEKYFFNQRYSGFFIPPNDGLYTFALIADDTARLYLSHNKSSQGKELIAYLNRYFYSWKGTTSNSRPIYLNAGKSYYIEGIHQQGAGRWTFGFGVKNHNLSWTNGLVDFEQQRVIIISTVIKETQDIIFATPPTIQIITIHAPTGRTHNFTYFLQFVNNTTNQLSYADNDTFIALELNALHSIQHIGKVVVERRYNKTNNTGDDCLIKLVILFVSNIPNLPLIKVLNYTNASTVVWQELQIPKSFSLSFNSRKTRLMPVHISTSNLSVEIMNLFTTECQRSSNGDIYFQDTYDVSGIGRVSSYGYLDNSREPFCDRYSLKNPTVLWKRGTTKDERTGRTLSTVTFSSFGYKYVCFARFGPIPYSQLSITVQDGSRSFNRHMSLTNTTLNAWKYECLNVFQFLHDSINNKFQTYQINQIYLSTKRPTSEDYWIDEFTISKSIQTVTPIQYAVRPGGIFVDNINVTYQDLVTPQLYCDDKDNIFSCHLRCCSFTVQYSVHHCGHNMPLITTDTNNVRVVRRYAGSLPVRGTFDLTFEKRTIYGIPSFSNATEFKKLLETYLRNDGTFIVTRSGNCFGYSWNVKWSQRGGDLPLMSASKRNLIGNNVSVSVLPLEEGGVWMRPLRGDMLRLPKLKPQAEVSINDIPSSCFKDENCTFTYTESNVPQVLYTTPTNEGQGGTRITIYGKGFTNDPSQVIVTIGKRSCDIVTLNDTVISCVLSLNEAGRQLVRVLVESIGYSLGDVMFEYSLSVTSIVPDRGTVGGGNVITLTGIGFSQDCSDSQVFFDGYLCRILTCNFTQLTCVPHPHGPGSITIAVIVNGVTFNVTNGYTYALDATTIINSIKPISGPSNGGTLLNITGQNFINTSNVSVTIGNVNCSIISITANNLVCLTGRNVPGAYDVIITSKNTFGRAIHSDALPQISSNNTISNISLFSYVFEISNVTPLSGSIFGGTVLNIEGEGFEGTLKVITEEGIDFCTKTVITYNRITCHTKSTARRHLIQNNGTHHILQKYFAWNPPILEITAGDTVTWSWNGSQLIPPQKFEVHSNTFKSSSSIVGNYTYKYNQPGTYKYSTYVDHLCLTCDMSGTIIVRAIAEKSVNIKVRLNDTKIEANYNLSNDTSRHNECWQQTLGKKPSFVYSLCDTPIVSEIDVKNSTIASNITLSGSGFTNNLNNVTILFGGYTCLPLMINDNEMMCRLNASLEPPPFVPLSLSLLVHNVGYAFLNTSMTEIVINPIVLDILPTNGSVLGGNTVLIQGTSLLGKALQVYLGSKKCSIRSMTYNQIEVIIPQAVITNISSNETFNITYGNQPNQYALCQIKDGCNYDYSIENTPIIKSVDPIEISGDTLLTITGDLLENDSVVKIGVHDCLNVTKTDVKNLTCTISPIRAGVYPLSVLTSKYGYANFVNDKIFNITSRLIINNFQPISGSYRGGTHLTLNGQGFCQKECINNITIGGKPCRVAYSNYTTLKCRTPDLNQNGNYSIIISIMASPYQVLISNLTKETFLYSLSDTPQITSITPNSGQFDDRVHIRGTGLSIDATVSIGRALCNITTSNSTNIVCHLGVNFVGSYLVDVYLPTKGKADGNIFFQYNLLVNNISPNKGSYSGRNILTINGLGFNPVSTFVTICNKICSTINPPSLQSIQCAIPDLSHLLTDGDVNCSIVLKSVGSTISLSQLYTLRRDLTPFLTSINRTRGGTAGGSLLELNGTGFTNNVTVTIAGTICTVREYSDTMIICETGFSGRTVKAPIMVYVQDKGYAISTTEQFFYVDLWSSMYTWGGKGLPIEGDFVIVPPKQTLVLDICTPVLSILLIQGGQLIFGDERDGVELHSENILIVDGGSLQIGTEEAPYQHKAQIVMYGNRVSTELPLFGAKTLAVRNGTLDLHGKPIINTWTCLSSTVRASEQILNVKHNVSDWEVGGTIVIASTSYSRRENEELIIQSISNNGKSITVTTPLQYTHISMVQTIHGKVIDTCAEVGYLTRNVVVRGNRNNEWDRNFTNCKDDFNPGQFAVQTCFNGRFGAETIGDQFGSQIMLHRGPNDTVVGRIEYIEVTHAGQAFRLGRYPIHFHLNGDVNGSYVRGCGIHHTFNRAVTIHGVDNLLVEHNVAFDILGQAYFLEDGIEEGNIIQYNLGIFVRASSSLLNEDITPATFWSVNPNNIFRHNAAAGGTHFGFWYHLPTNPTGPSYTPTVRPINRPMGQFYNNTAHSFGWYGIWIFVGYYPERIDTCNNVTPAIFEHFLAWRNVRGVEFSEVGAVQLKHSIMLDNTLAGVEYTKVSSAWGKNGALIEDVLIVAQSDLKYADNSSPTVCTGAGIKTPHSYYLTVSNVTFVNFNESGCYALQACSHCRSKQGGFETRFEKLIFDNSPNIASWKWEHEQVFRDLDGTLTGIPGGSLLPLSNALPSGHCTRHENSSFGTIHGAVCDGTVSFTRFALTAPVPSSLTFRILSLTSQYGILNLEYVLKRLLHGPGYMGIIPTKEIYQLDWSGGERFTNISYSSLYSGMTSNDYLWIRHDFNKTISTFKINNKIKNSTTSEPPGGTSQLGDRYISENDSIITYYVNGTHPTCPVDLQVTFSSFLCLYTDCIIPPPPTTSPPVIPGRPNVTYYWSNASIWWNGQLPVNDTDVVINSSLYVLVDVSLPRFNTLIIQGGLEFVDDRNYLVEAHRIMIDGGQLVAGSPDEPFEHQLEIVLLGDLSSPEYRLPNFGPVLGAKALGVFGHLSLHGQEHSITWTSLSRMAKAGDTQLYVSKPVKDWYPGNEIVISSTSYESRQAEERIIANISNDGTIITITQPLLYNHHGGQYNTGECTVNISAEVGLLSRNIKILGTHPNDTNDVSKVQSYGCRVLVSNYFNSSRQLFMTGSARLSGVEFKGCGQEGFEDSFDPRYSLAFLSTGTVVNNNSYITNCSFHGGYSVGIGVFGAHNMTISDNVVHRTVGPSFYITGKGHAVKNNLAVVALFPGTYRTPEEPLNDKWTANYELAEANDLLLIGNSAAGGAKAGFHTNGESCIATDFTPLWSDNIAHSTLHGVHVGYTDGQVGCSAFNKFTIYSCYHYGLMAYSKAGILITNSTFINNYAATFTAVIGPPAVSHAVSIKTVIIRDTTIISSIHSSNGSGDSINCTEYNYKPIIAYHPRSHSPAIQSPSKGHVGVILTSFTSGRGGFPKFKWTVKHNYPAIAGLTKLINVKFCNFGTHCSSMKEVALMTDPSSEDAQHPVWTERVSYKMGSNSSKFYNHNPHLGSINPSDCVDMDCDGLKKILIRDIDGSFTGNGNKLSSLISRSEYEWNGDRRRGLGDYRIPIAMLSEADGSRIPVNSIYPNKGIYRGNTTCQWMVEYNSYQCTNIDHMMLIIESLDADTEVRRLSPIGLGASGYIDLINGPQDHGWCGGYTCQERISTFYTIVSTGLNYTIGLTSTNPQRTNFILLNANDNQSIRIGYIYNNPQRLDVYIGSDYIIPTNGYMLDGNLRYRRGNNFEPSLTTDPHGTNYYDSKLKILYIIIRGSVAVRVETTMIIQLGIQLPPVTVNEFFETNLVQNLAALLGITSDRIRIVDVISEGGTRRKRQSAGKTIVNIQIGNPPSNNTSDNNDTMNTAGPTSEETATYNELINITTMFSIAVQTGTISRSIGHTVQSASVIEPRPIVSDPTNGQRATNETGGPQPGENGTETLKTFAEKQLEEEQKRENNTESIPLIIPTRLSITTHPSTGIEGVPLNEITLEMYDATGSVVPYLGIGSPWLLTLTTTPSQSFPNSTISIGNGQATYNELIFDYTGNYQLSYDITYPSNVNFKVGTTISIQRRELYIQIIRQPPLTANNTYPFTTKLQIMDSNINTVADNLGWRGREWYMTAIAISQSNRQILGTIKIIDGTAEFSDIYIKREGTYIIQYTVYTIPASTANELPSSVNSNPVTIQQYPFTRFIAQFNESYSSIVRGFETQFVNSLKSHIKSIDNTIFIYNITIWEGSIMASFFASSESSNTLLAFSNNIQSTPEILQFNFRNYNLTIISIIQDPNYPIIDNTKNSNRAIIAIIIISVNIITLVYLLMVCNISFTTSYCIKKKRNKIKVRHIDVKPIYESNLIYSNYSLDEWERPQTRPATPPFLRQSQETRQLLELWEQSRSTTPSSMASTQLTSFSQVSSNEDTNSIVSHPHSATSRDY